jgi:N-[(2S)-2-amino-2-carboxyethyl]-L-glutamate dehydrogenase
MGDAATRPVENQHKQVESPAFHRAPRRLRTATRTDAGRALMGKRSSFLYLSEPDMIAAGVLDAPQCVDVCEDVFRLLAVGDYLMGGPNHSSHGLGIEFPEESPFPTMPLAGPDRRFVAMPAYLGGRYDVCGNKWYGSNPRNNACGLPRSVLTVMLNDKDTGEPLCLMSANLLSSARTGAIPGVAVRHLARKDSEVCTVIGCGPINQACFCGIVSQMPSVRRVVCYDISELTARTFADWSQARFGFKAEVANSVEEAVGEADVVTVAASRLKPLFVEDAWFKTGATVLLTGPMKAEDAFWLNSRIVYDHIALQEAYVVEALTAPEKLKYYDGVIGGPLYKLIDDGKLPPLRESADLGNVILGNKIGRESAVQRVVFVACGMAVFDVAWGFELYQNALRRGLGLELELWEEPYREGDVRPMLLAEADQAKGPDGMEPRPA